MKKTAQQIVGEKVLSRVVEEVEGVAFSFRCVCVCVCVNYCLLLMSLCFMYLLYVISNVCV